MNNSKHLLPAIRFSLVIIIAGFLITVTSCKKSNDNPDGSSFAGVYYGTLVSGFYSEGDTITIPASTSSTIVMNTKTGINSTYSIHGTVSGSSLTIASQAVTIPNLGATYTVSGTGSLNNSTLVIHYVFVSPGNVTTNWTFTGSRN